MGWVLDNSTSTGSCRLVLLAIANHASSDGCEAWPTVETIGREAKVSRATVFRALDELEQAGLLRIEHGVGGGEKTPANYRPNRYTVLMSGSQTETSNPFQGSHIEPSGVSSTQDRGLTDETQTVLQPSSTISSSPGEQTKKRACRVPQPFDVTDEMAAWAEKNVPNVDWDRETPKFLDYWRGIPGKPGTKLDWPATWRNWMRNNAERANR